MLSALNALHLILVAVRNIGYLNSDSKIPLEIIDAIECIPLWIADQNIDRTSDMLQVIEALAVEHPECGLALAVLRD